MNWKRLAELAVHIVENYNKDHGTLKLPEQFQVNGKTEIVFDMTSWIGEVPDSGNKCGYSCCALGYAVLLWPNDLSGHEKDMTKNLDDLYDRGIQAEDRASIFDCEGEMSIHPESYSSLSAELLHKLFASELPNDPIYFSRRAYRLMERYKILPEAPELLSDNQIIDKLKKYIAEN